MSNEGQENPGSSNHQDQEPMAAITYPAASNTVSAPAPSQPRQPHNLQDLLRYSVEAGSSAEGSASAASLSITAMDEEAKRYLEEALQFMTVDVVGELLKSIEIVRTANELSEVDSPTECEEALDHIFEYIDNLDVANDFHKIGGFCILKPCLDSGHSSIRWRGAELIAELCQNNPYCQEKVLEAGVLSSLLSMVDTDVNQTVRVKALYAISCLIRDNDDGLKEFSDKDGYSVLLRALQSDVQKLNIKSAFLLSSLCNQKPHIIDESVKMGYIEQLVGQIGIQTMCSSDHSQTAEHLLNALLLIVKDHEESQAICRKPELQFESILNCILENSDGKDEYREENEYAQSLLKIVFAETDCTIEEDR